MRPLEARVLAGLGQAQVLAGRPDAARPHLVEAIGLLRSAAMHRWLARAEALLAATA